MLECCKKCETERKTYCECEYNSIIQSILGDNFSHIDCPDITMPNSVDLLFSNGVKDVEVELKTITVDFEDRNSIAHERYMQLLIDKLSEVIDSDYSIYVKIEMKKKLTNRLLHRNVFPLVNEIANCDDEKLPLVYENEHVIITLDYINESNVGSITDEHLIFGISPPIKDSTADSLWINEISEKLLDFKVIHHKIEDYLNDKSFQNKFKLESSLKIPMFIIKYPLMLNALIEPFKNEVGIDVIDEMFKYLRENLEKGKIYDSLIICYENIETDDLEYFII